MSSGPWLRAGDSYARLAEPEIRAAYGAFTLAALLLIDWRSGLVLAVAGVPLYFLMRWFYRNSQRAYRESRVVSAKVIVKFVETMTGIRAVKAFRKEPRNDEEFGDLSGQYRDVNMRSLRLSLRNPDFTTSKRVASAINDFMGADTAEPTDPATVPPSYAPAS